MESRGGEGGGGQKKRRHIVTEMSSWKVGDLTEGGLLHLTVLPVSLSGI